jgi:hypothetical protein
LRKRYGHSLPDDDAGREDLRELLLLASLAYNPERTLHVRRVKNGTPATHPLTGDHLRALRRLQRESKSPFVFISERSAPFTTRGFQALVERAAEADMNCCTTHVRDESWTSSLPSKIPTKIITPSHALDCEVSVARII